MQNNANNNCGELGDLVGYNTSLLGVQLFLSVAYTVKSRQFGTLYMYI